MKTFSTKLGLAVGLLGWAVAPLQADFILTGSQYLEVTTTHNRGQMFDTSMALVHMGGRVYWLETFDWSSLGIGAGGYVDWLSTGGQSQTTIDGGAVWWLDAWQNSGVQLWNGPVAYAFLGDQARLDISGGNVHSVWIYPQWAFGPVRLTMTDGSIGYLVVTLALQGGDQVLWNGQVSDLWPHGVQVQGGWIGELWANFETYDLSRLDITGGLTDWIYATGSSTIQISDGEIGSIEALDQSSTFISGGQIGRGIYAGGNSSVQMTGGQAQSMDVDAWAYGPDRISITGGTLDELSVHLTAYDHQHVVYSGQLADLAPHGILAETACVLRWRVSFTVLEQAEVEISGGDVNQVEGHDESWIIVTGGTIGAVEPNGAPSAPRLEAAHAEPASPGGITASSHAHVVISGGEVMELHLYEQAWARVRGGLVIWLTAHGETQVILEGGIIASLAARDESTTWFIGYDFLALDGLTIEGNRVLGTGLLVGRWLDGTEWSTWIVYHDASATIFIPEPATLGVLGWCAWAGLLLRRRER